MKWVLIWFVVTTYSNNIGTATHSAVFNNELRCNAARLTLMGAFGDLRVAGRKSISAVCVARGLLQ